MQIRNATSRARAIAALDLRVEPGETVDVPDELGSSLLDQPANWEPAPKPKTKSKED